MLGTQVLRKQSITKMFFFAHRYSLVEEYLIDIRLQEVEESLNEIVSDTPDSVHIRKYLPEVWIWESFNLGNTRSVIFRVK